MQPDLLQLLRAQGATIHVRWETLLRLEPVSGPLANPDALVRLIPESIEEVFDLLSEKPGMSLTLQSAAGERLPPCDCGHNPYLAYFVAGERAFVEAIVLLQASLPASARSESDVAQVIRAVRRLGIDEIDTFCGICTQRGTADHCRHVHAGGR